MKRVLAWVGAATVGLSMGFWFYGDHFLPTADPIAKGETTAPSAQSNATTGNSVDTSTGSEAPVASTEPSEISSNSIRSTPPAIPPTPLPPIGTPVAEILDELKTRAAQGDSTASCRLAYELQRCSEAEWANSVSKSVESDLARRPVTPPGAPETLARIRGIAETQGKGCEGVSDADRALAFDLQMKAAEARPELRIWAALNPALDPWNIVNELEHWQRYRAIAMTWLEQAAAQGDISAVIALQRVHGDMRRNSPPYPRFRVRDDERFVMYTDLLKRYGVEFSAVQPEYESRRAALDPAALSRIEQQVASLHRSDVPPANKITALDYSMRYVPEPEDCVPR